MLQDQNNGNENDGTDATQTYRYYDNKINLNYGIVQRYDIKKQNNQIKLTVDYKGMNLTAETSFTFTKQGEPGTNGTEYIVKLIPNVRAGYNAPLWPMITKAGSQYLLNYRLPTGNGNQSESFIDNSNFYQILKAQLWHSGELIWQGFTNADNAVDGDTKPSLVHWDILCNKYNLKVSDTTAFEIEEGGTGKIRYLGDNLQSNIKIPFANIIKCSITWNGKTYYGTIPIITAWVINNNYRIGLKDFTGFRYVMYTSDGMSPQYDNSHPFDFICQQKISNVWEDISTVPGEHEIFYVSDAIGNYYPMNADTDTEPIKSNLLEPLNSQIYTKDLAKNQFRFRPASRYDGVCVNETVYCEYTQNEEIIGKIHVPIHFLLNKYGLANINEWDGNSVQIDDEGGFILSPQMGAGHKNSENQFTGVLMGEVRTPGKSNADIGLLGYHNGDRSFFLNSENGSAIFGKANQGQITIDPSTNNAMLYSGNFWLNYNQNGLPINYNKNNERGQGLLIDLTTPEIRYGNGKFYVNNQGYIHAAGGGDIAGWKIDDHSLYSDVKNGNGKIVLDAGIYDENTDTVTGPGKIYSHKHSALDAAEEGFYLAHDGLSIGRKVKITNDGVMYLGAGAVNPKSGQKCWTINGNDNGESYIAYGTTGWIEGNLDNGKSKTVYLGTNGLSLGDGFSVTPQGELKAYRGKIGGWDITKTKLSAGKIELDASNGSMKGGSSYPWSISSSGEANFNRINANASGTIAGWNISSNRLSKGKLYLDSGGSIGGDGWSISAGGIASFARGTSLSIGGSFGLSGSGSINGPVGVGGGGSVAGNGIAVNGSLPSIVNPDVATTNGRQTLGDYIQLKVDNLDVMKKLTYQGWSAGWTEGIRSITGLDLSISNGVLTATVHFITAPMLSCNNTGFYNYDNRHDDVVLPKQ